MNAHGKCAATKSPPFIKAAFSLPHLQLFGGGSPANDTLLSNTIWPDFTKSSLPLHKMQKKKEKQKKKKTGVEQNSKQARA